MKASNNDFRSQVVDRGVQQPLARAARIDWENFLPRVYERLGAPFGANLRQQTVRPGSYDHLRRRVGWYEALCHRERPFSQWPISCVAIRLLAAIPETVPDAGNVEQRDG